jgi:hypothetical protein
MGRNIHERVWRCTAALALLLAGASTAGAQDLRDPWREYYTAAPLGPSTTTGEFAAGIGYAYVNVGGSDSPLDSASALRLEFSGSFSPVESLPQLRLGGAIGTAAVFDDSDLAIISSGGVVVVGHSTIPLWLLEPELRLSWRQPLGNEGLFIEPGVGAGALIAFLSVQSDDSLSGRSFDETDTGLSVRGFVNVGVLAGGGIAGVQISYAHAQDIHLADNISGGVDEFYIGIFGILRL